MYAGGNHGKRLLEQKWKLVSNFVAGKIETMGP
jgi:hypothetical protein